MLKVKNLDAGYGNVPILFDISLSIEPGEVVSIVGSNGAGKSTLLKVLSGLIRPKRGSIEFLGEPIHAIAAHEIVRRGLSHVPEGRQVFGKMSVRDNLLLGAFTVKDIGRINRRLAEIYDLFPILKERKYQKAETLSGGEQQMLAIARGLMPEPQLLLIDEISLGLAPVLVDRVMDALRVISKEVTILMVEQKIQEALEIADRGYILQNGSFVLEGSGRELLQSTIVKKAYLGL